MNVNPGLLPSISNYIAPRKRPPIREWAEDDRPREKLVNKGAATLSHAEILAILLNTGTPERSAVELAREILDSVDNNLSELARMSIICGNSGVSAKRKRSPSSQPLSLPGGGRASPCLTSLLSGAVRKQRRF